MIDLGTAREFPFWHLVDRRAAATPDRLMLIDENERRVTFGEFRTAALRAAAELHAVGIGRDSVVAWQLPTSIDALVLMAALSRLEATQCPLIPVLRERDVGFITKQVGADLLVVPETFRGFDHGSMARTLAARHGFAAWCLNADVPIGASSDGHSDDRIDLPEFQGVGGPESPVRWIYYTSGTTSDPKGVKHTDRSAISTTTHLVGGVLVEPDDALLTVAPIAHVGGVMTLAAQLMTGFRLALMAAFDPQKTPAFAAHHDVTILRAPEPVVMACIQAQQQHGREPMFPHVRMVACGGASRSQHLNVRVQETFGLEGALSSYGMTECPGVASTNLHDSVDTIAQTSGRVTPDTEVLIVDDEDKPCPAGVEGELYVRGPQLFSGYVDPQLDVGALDPSGYFRSGDLAVVDDRGFIRITGRIKDIIIRNGENISALEIEDVVGLHPNIAAVAVIAVPDDRTGERACAVIELEPGQSPIDLVELAETCRSGGLSKQKIPEQIEFVPELPRNAMAKIEKAKLRDRFG